MVTMRNETTIGTPMFSCGKCLAHSISALGAILRRVGRIHFDYLTAGAFSLARKDRNELTPSGVTDALGEMMIFHHPAHVQVFDGDRIELSHDIERRLVVKVRTLALNLPMFLPKQFDRLTSAVTSLIRSARDCAPGRLQFSFGYAVVFRVLNYFTRAQRGKVLNADIDAKVVTGLRKESGLILFDGEDHRPAIRLTFNRAGLACSFHRTRKPDATRSYFGEMELVAFEPETALGIGERIVSRRGLESWIAWRLSIFHAAEEGVEGLINAAQSILKNLAVDLAYIFTDLFDLRKLDGLSVIVDRKPIDPIGVAPLLKRGVVEFAANIQRDAACRFKLRIGLQLIFVCLHFLHYTLVPMAKQQLQALHHCVFSLHFHLVLVTKYRRKAITKEILERLDTIFRETLEKWHSELIEFNGEEDHVHLLFQTNPTVQPSKLVNNLKTVSSRLIRRDFRAHVNQMYRKPVFWHRSYCLISTGGASIEMLRKYIEEQGYQD